MGNNKIGKVLINRAQVSRVNYLLALLIVLSSLGCGHYIAPYNETAYQNATDLKVESLTLIDKAAEPYSDHEQEVQSLMLKIDQAHEFAKGLPNNELTTKQWAIMIDPDGNMLGGFLQKWKNDGQLNAVFVQQANGQVSKGFDQIIELESAKIKE